MLTWKRSQKRFEGPSETIFSDISLSVIYQMVCEFKNGFPIRFFCVFRCFSRGMIADVDFTLKNIQRMRGCVYWASKKKWIPKKLRSNFCFFQIDQKTLLDNFWIILFFWSDFFRSILSARSARLKKPSGRLNVLWLWMLPLLQWTITAERSTFVFPWSLKHLFFFDILIIINVFIVKLSLLYSYRYSLLVLRYIISVIAWS